MAEGERVCFVRGTPVSFDREKFCSGKPVYLYKSLQNRYNDYGLGEIQLFLAVPIVFEKYE